MRERVRKERESVEERKNEKGERCAEERKMRKERESVEERKSEKGERKRERRGKVRKESEIPKDVCSS
jgi:hypothetical protein